MNDLDARLEAVFQTLQDSVTDERGYGGPVAHVATVDGWDLRMSTSDFGDATYSAVNKEHRLHFDLTREKIYGHHFAHSKEYNTWIDLGQVTDKDKELGADLAERATWRDTIKRKKDEA